MPDRYQLLLAEASASEARLIVHELAMARLDVDFQTVGSAADMELALAARPWDFVIFADPLADFHWTAALALCKQKELDIPFIMVSELPEVDPGVQRIKAGVHEHVLKGNLACLPAAVRRELRSAQERRIRLHAKSTGELFATAGGVSSGVAVIGVALDGVVVSWDASAEKLFGYSASEIIGHSVSAGVLSEVFSLIVSGVDGEKRCIETVCCRKDGAKVGTQILVCWIEDLFGRKIGASLVVRDRGKSDQWSDWGLTAFLGNTAARSATDQLDGQQKAPGDVRT